MCFNQIYLNIGVAKWSGPCGAVRSPLKKNAGPVAYFNLLAHLGPPHITHNPHGPSAGWGELARITHITLKCIIFFYTPIFSSCSLIFYIPKFLITSYYACHENNIMRPFT